MEGLYLYGEKYLVDDIVNMIVTCTSLILPFWLMLLDWNLVSLSRDPIGCCHSFLFLWLKFLLICKIDCAMDDEHVWGAMDDEHLWGNVFFGGPWIGEFWIPSLFL